MNQVEGIPAVDCVENNCRIEVEVGGKRIDERAGGCIFHVDRHIDVVRGAWLPKK